MHSVVTSKNLPHKLNIHYLTKFLTGINKYFIVCCDTSNLTGKWVQLAIMICLDPHGTSEKKITAQDKYFSSKFHRSLNER